MDSVVPCIDNPGFWYMAKSDELKTWTERSWHKLDFECGLAISKAEFRNLKRLLKDDPNDCSAHRILLGYYLNILHSYSQPANREFAEKEYLKHLIWLIQNHPENEDLAHCQTIVNVDVREIERMWNKSLQENPKNSIISKNANAFFNMLDSAG